MIGWNAVWHASFTVILLLTIHLLSGTGAHFDDVRDDLRHFESISDFSLRAHGVSRRRLTFDSLHRTDGLRTAGYPEVWFGFKFKFAD